MAYPIIRSVSYGQLTDENNYQFTIPLPSGIQTGDVLIGLVVAQTSCTALTLDATSSSNFKNELSRTRSLFSKLWHQNGNYIWWLVNDSFHLSAAYWITEALGNGNDVLNLSSYLAKVNWLGLTGDVTSYIRPCKLSYFCYCFSYYPWHAKKWNIQSTTASSNWDFSQFGSASGWTTDSMWLFLLGSGPNAAATASPTGWSTLQKTEGSIFVRFSSSISSTYLQTTGINQINPGPFTNPSSAYMGYLLRIMESPTGGIEDPDEDPPTSVGGCFYIPMYSKVVSGLKDEKYISTDIIEMRFSDNTDACSAGNLAIIESNGAWTASWIDDIDFEASVMSGISGTTYVYITCKAINYSGDILSDILTLTCGTTTTSICVYQNSVGNGCTW